MGVLAHMLVGGMISAQDAARAMAERVPFGAAPVPMLARTLPTVEPGAQSNRTVPPLTLEAWRRPTSGGWSRVARVARRQAVDHHGRVDREQLSEE